MAQLRFAGQETDRRRSVEPRLHRRQFILGPEPFLAGEGWISEQIGPSLHLSRCPELPVASVTDERGVTWRLLGLALQSDPDAPEPLEQLAGNEQSALLDTYGSWSGRWILISDSEIHLDAGGLIGCFYRTIQHGSTTELWASSSPVLIVAIPGRERIRRVGPKLHVGKGMDWFPLPRSGFAGVNKLLPTQVLSLAPMADRRVLPRPPLVDEQKPTTYDEALDTLQRSLVTSLSRLRESGEAIWLPLTAGLDSRLILAAARQADLSLRTFTQHYPLMESADSHFPPLLARELGYEHRQLRPGRFSRSRRALFDAHTAGQCVDGDRRFFAHGQWEMIPAPALILRGGVFELGRCYFHRKFPEPAARDLVELIATRFHFGEFHPTSTVHLAGIAEWVEWTARTSQPGLDWRDRLYLEQRIAGWVSSIEQALDLTSYTRAYIANCHAYMTTVLTLPEAARRTSQHHIDLIGRMAPQLLRFPFNPADGRLALSRRLRDEWYELAARPRKRRYAAYVAQRGAGRARQALARLR
ncbi:MAG: hypothetical protein H0W90_13830 [Actinobacteria bacterium]|nr:hypothetical protein [Actinomycetota bacterium]